MSSTQDIDEMNIALGCNDEHALLPNFNLPPSKDDTVPSSPLPPLSKKKVTLATKIQPTMTTRSKTSSSTLRHALDEDDSSSSDEEAFIFRKKEDLPRENDVFHVDLVEYLADLRIMEKDMDRSSLASGAMNASNITEKHVNRRNRTLDSFIKTLGTVGKY